MKRQEHPELNRRRAMCTMGAGLAGLNFACADEAGKGIAEIRMKSSRLDELRQFYEDKLGLPVVLKSDKLTVEAGATRLIFSPTETTGSEPFYHYAFNIPENKIESAVQWQKQHTPLLKQGKKEIFNFSAINAHSMYFNDPAGNIVEYIARHDLENSAAGEFSPKDILYASEIGLVVDDVKSTETDIKDALGLKYSRGYRSQSFTMVGDNHAMLILVKRDRKWFPNRKQTAEVFPVETTIHGSNNGEMLNADFDYKVNVIASKT